MNTNPGMKRILNRATRYATVKQVNLTPEAARAYLRGPQHRLRDAYARDTEEAPVTIINE